MPGHSYGSRIARRLINGSRSVASHWIARSFAGRFRYPVKTYEGSGIRGPCSPRSRSMSCAAARVAPTAMDGYLRWIDRCNDGTALLAESIPFEVDGQVLGYVSESFADTLKHFPDTFQVAADVLKLNEQLISCDQRTQAVAGVLTQLREQGLVSGWRDELYPVSSSFHAEPALLMERAAVTLFGVKGYGVHVNGYVQREDGLYLWVARRSSSKPTWPGKLDHIIAGGQPQGLTCKENVVKEAAEEAGVPEAMALQAQACGAVSYCACVEAAGVKRDVLFVYDLQLPPDFVPQPQDGEVQSFQLWPVSRVMEVVRDTDEYKDNCNLVIIDFLVRRGFITPEETGYLDVVRRLRLADCS